jgi:hypothetical protein
MSPNARGQGTVCAYGTAAIQVPFRYSDSLNNAGNYTYNKI